MKRNLSTLKSILLVLGLATGCQAAPPAGVRLIAHRGGIVDPRYSENSPASLEAAVAKGYWGIESDIRETKDHVVITNHDANFFRFYGDKRHVGEVTIEEVRALKANPGGTAPMTFAELADACKGRLHLMLDIKEPEHDGAFYQEIEKQLRRTNLLDSTYIIGIGQGQRYFKGKARVNVKLKQLQEAVARGEDVSQLYFLFEWGKDHHARGSSLRAGTQGGRGADGEHVPLR
ncbi:MAG TPA: glycerophosphodiester phosphodiesterase family protein [Bryobacteraceae bacterium]|nr:glycerophosphodiester phosphodiesterase family protein [Bryobacteraceae bacterium]